LKGFNTYPYGLEARALQSGLVGVGGEVGYRDTQLIAQTFGGFDAVHVALETNIHQDEVGRGGCRLLEGFSG
jgi:hypothetical protein